MANNKRATQIRHFKARMFQRYGLSVSDKQIEQVVSLIKDSPIWIKQSLRVIIHEVDLSRIWPETKEIALIAYDKQRKVPVTCLTKEMIV